jgi:hypothetical protein
MVFAGRQTPTSYHILLPRVPGAGQL